MIDRSLIIALTALLGIAGAAASPAAAGEWTLSGAAAAELRWFPSDPAFGDQLTDWQPSLTLAPELRWRSDDRRHQVKLSPFGRWDAEDDERTHFDLREGFYRYLGDRWELLAGVNRVFWGVTESRHLVDVINQVDAVEDVDEEDKLGQPMIQLALERSWGRLELYSLLGFRERTFPGRDGRLRAPIVVDTDNPLYESGAEEKRIDWALRWSHVLGDFDLGAHLFHGTGREPTLLFDDVGPRLIPFYQVTTQLGVDLQYTRQAWLWKLEGLVREGQGDTFGAVVAGFEYTLYQLGGSAADLGLIVELNHDGRDETAPPTIYDDDTFVGARLALNDLQDTSVLVGALVDHGDGSTAVFLEAERRLGDHVSLEIEGRFFVNADPAGDLAFVAQDDVLTVRASWNF